MAKKPKGADAPAADVFAMMEEHSKVSLRRAPSAEELNKMVELATEMATTLDRITRGEELLKTLRARVLEIQTKDLVDLMDEVMTDHLGLPDQDADVRVFTKVHASLPALPDPDKKPEEWAIANAKRERAFAWLAEEGHDGLINTLVTVTFPKGGVRRAKQFTEEMNQRATEFADTHDGERPYGVECVQSVHWGSLTALVKDLNNQGRADLPLADLGAHIFRMADVEKRKERKTTTSSKPRK